MMMRGMTVSTINQVHHGEQTMAVMTNDDSGKYNEWLIYKQWQHSNQPGLLRQQQTITPHDRDNDLIQLFC